MYKRQEVIHQKNAGLSPARNSGMKAAKGKYISFIDGDDYIHPQMYEVLLEALQEGNYSFSMILGKQVYDNDKSYSIPSAYTKSILTQEIMIKSLFNHIHPQQGIKEVQAQVVWNKLYKRELLDNEFFQETGTEDTEFNCRIYQKSCQAVIIDIPMYYWVQRPTSITHQNDIGSPLVAKCTDADLLQLLINLLDNAIYWLEEKDNKTVVITLDGNNCKLIFSDSGPGIRDEDKPYIFDAFYSGKGQEGRGLGLYISRKLMERNDYSIELADIDEDKILAGANFVVNFIKQEHNEY